MPAARPNPSGPALTTRPRLVIWPASLRFRGRLGEGGPEPTLLPSEVERAPLISPDTLATIRDRTDIVAVISESVPTLKRRGRSWVGLCPFHKEKSPSFHVNPDRGFFHCFGCKESGSAIDFLMKSDGLTFPEAVRDLAERLGIVIEEEKGPRTEVDRQKKLRDDLYTANQLAATFFEDQLKHHPARQYAVDELARRALVPSFLREVPGENQSAIDDAIQAFRIGYAPPGWDGLANFMRAQSASPLAAEAVGLLVPRSSGTGHYDRFRHRLMFAVLDPQGRVIAFSGRALAPLPEDKPDVVPAKYINSPESPIYTKGSALFGIYQARHAIRQGDSAILVEGNFDVVSLHAAGVSNVVAPLGTAFTEDQAKLLRRYSQNITLLFDGDAAGQNATRKSREPCLRAGLSAKVASLPTGVDPDEFVRLQGVQKLHELTQRAQGMLEHLIEVELSETFGSADAHERAERVARVNKVLSEEQDPLVRSMAKAYADQVAGRLDLVRAGGMEAFRALERSVERALAEEKAQARTPNPREARIKPKPPGSAERAEMVGAIIEFPALLDDPLVQEQLSLLEGASARTVAAVSDALRIAFVGEPPTLQKGLDTGNFLAQIPPAIQAFASRRLAAPEHLSLETAKEHLLENAQKLKRLVLHRETFDIAREQYRAAGDWEKETELAREASDRVRQKHGL